MKKIDGSWSLKNRHIERCFVAKEGVLGTDKLIHCQSRKSQPALGPEFMLVCQDGRLEPSNFLLSSHPSQTETEIRFELKSCLSDCPLTIGLTYQLPEDASVMRKRMTIHNASEKSSYSIEEIFIETIPMGDGTICAEGIGQPVFSGEFFFGVEYPAFWTANLGGSEGLSVVPAVVLEPGECLSLPCGVVGASLSGDIRTSFRDYLDSIRGGKDGVFTLINTWYHTPILDEETCLDLVGDVREKWTDRHPGTLDAFVLDDGWDDLTRLWHPHPERFPQGLGAVAKAVKKSGLRVGLWCSPWGGYHEARATRSRNGYRQGFGTIEDEHQKNDYLCLGEDNYFHYYLERLLDLVQTHEISFLKLDGFPALCNNPRHGHPVGRGSTDWNCRRMIEVCRALRKACPEIFLLATVGFWQSPWWLMFVDAVYIGGDDWDMLGEGSSRQRDITYRDKSIHTQIVEKRSQMPLASAGIHGLIKAGYWPNHLKKAYPREMIFSEESIEEWEYLVWMNVGRGVGMFETYISPALLGEAHFKVLSEGITYLRNHWDTLRHSTWTGGDPAAGEIYAFAHTGKEKTIFCVRNPSARPLSLNLGLKKLLVIKTFGEMKVDGGSVALGPFAMVLVEAANA